MKGGAGFSSSIESQQIITWNIVGGGKLAPSIDMGSQQPTH